MTTQRTSMFAGGLTTSRKKHLGRLLLIATGVFLSLLVVEISLRAVGFSDPSLFYIYDHERGIALRPFAQGWWRKEGNNYVRINSRGYHDGEHTLSKPPGTLRIAVLGDSYAEAMQVPLQNAFWAEAERRLEQCPMMVGRKVEVLNFGVSGYGTAQELITLRENVWAYSPDIVLLAFTTGNDLNDNFRPLSADYMRPYFVYRDGKLVLDRSTLTTIESSKTFRLRNSVAGHAFDWLRQHLRMLQLIDLANKALRAGANEPASLQSEAKIQVVATNSAIDNRATPSQEPGLDNRVYSAPVTEEWKEAWHVTEGLISQMHDEVHARGARFFVVTLSNPNQVSPNILSAKDERSETNNLFYPDLRIRALGDKENFPVLNLAPLLRKFAVEQKVYFHGFDSGIGLGHWNESGHRVAGDLIADWICAESVH